MFGPRTSTMPRTHGVSSQMSQKPGPATTNTSSSPAFGIMPLAFLHSMGMKNLAWVRLSWRHHLPQPKAVWVRHALRRPRGVQVEDPSWCLLEVKVLDPARLPRQRQAIQHQQQVDTPGTSATRRLPISRLLHRLDGAMLMLKTRGPRPSTTTRIMTKAITLTLRPALPASSEDPTVTNARQPRVVAAIPILGARAPILTLGTS